MRALWLPDALRHFGIEPILVDGWDLRGSESADFRGSVDHHTAGAAASYMPSLGILINGRSDLPGPLCNTAGPRSEPGDMRVYVVAAGRANHAGRGGWKGLSGNSSVLGHERENVGTTREPWTPHRLDVAARVHAAFAWGARFDPSFTCEHKEWAPTRKIDVHTTTGDTLRGMVVRLLAGPAPVLQPVEYPEENMKRIPLKCDFFEGRGYVDVFGHHRDSVITANVLGPDPEVAGWDATNVPAMEKATHGATARIVFEANRPVNAEDVPVEVWVVG